jgi:hypothetical protein
MRTRLVLGWVVSAAMFAACTNDYDTFENQPGAATGGTTGDASPDVAKGGAAGKAGAGGISGAGGTSKGGAAGQGGTNKGGTAGQAGANQGGTAGQGGTNQGGTAGQGGTNQGGTAGQAGASQGGMAGSAGNAGDAATEEAGGCTASQKLCGTSCVTKTDPDYGCVDSACDPCALANATPQCTAGACAVQSCDSGFGNCDSDASNGCEADITADVNACGGCNRKCLGTHVATGGMTCAAELCTSTCETGFGNCSQPAAPSPDNGCETDLQTAAADCGACGHDCTKLGPGGSPMGCLAGACGCGSNTDCGGSGTCNTTTGVCTCGGTQCNSGEWCRKLSGNTWVCTCFANSDCGAGEVCCPTTNGCSNNCPL